MPSIMIDLSHLNSIVQITFIQRVFPPPGYPVEKTSALQVRFRASALPPAKLARMIIPYIPSDKLANLKCLSISLIIAYPCPKTCMPWVISIIWALASIY